MLQRVVTATLESACEKVIVVLGHDDENVRSVLSVHEDDERCEFVVNHDYKEGMSTSLKKGVTSMEDNMDAAMFILGDMPFSTSEVMDKLIDSYRASCASICVPYIKEKRGNPAIIKRDLFPRIMELTGDIGARDIIERSPELTLKVLLEDETTQVDIDTKDDLKEQTWRSSNG